MAERKNSVSHAHKHLSKLHAQIHRKSNFFPGQRDSEEVKLCIRTHWIQPARIFVLFLILGIILPAGVLYVIAIINPPANIWLLTKLIVLMYFLFAWLLTFIEFIKNEFTLLVATNERIADIAQVSLFDQQISETNLDRIQEVAGYTRGILKTFLDIGHLEIQTAGSDAPLIMRFVKSPQLTARKILDIQHESQRQRRASDTSKRSGDQLRRRKDENLSEEEIRRMRSGESGASNGEHLRESRGGVN